jgi:hypothetical protein
MNNRLVFLKTPGEFPLPCSAFMEPAAPMVLESTAVANLNELHLKD